MPSPLAEKAIEEAQKVGKAILKFVSANDCGLTGSHQAGFYLPKSAWELYAPFAPEKGKLEKSKIRITWQGGERATDSVVTWYGQKTRFEYRLTSFGKGFPYLIDDSVGDLLVLIPQDLHNFLAYIIDLPEDIEDIQAALGVEAIGTWVVYEGAKEPHPLSSEDCIDKQFRAFAQGLETFPAGNLFSEKTREAMIGCVHDFGKKPSDDRLMDLMKGEYRLFRLVERQICLPEVRRLFKDIDDFLKTAATLMNRRKSRAGRSMKNHVEYLLKDAKIPFDAHPQIDGDPDIVIPGKAAYDDPKFPSGKLFAVGVQTTCKDRWRQVTQEAPRIEWKHLITLQEGLSARQLTQMNQHKVTLVVPQKLHSRYPQVKGTQLMDMEGFIRTIRKRLT
jgi:EcoRII C terminal/Restriction endonuclease EcoRII, N-terminal